MATKRHNTKAPFFAVGCCCWCPPKVVVLPLSVRMRQGTAIEMGTISVGMKQSVRPFPDGRVIVGWRAWRIVSCCSQKAWGINIFFRGDWRVSCFEAIYVSDYLIHLLFSFVLFGFTFCFLGPGPKVWIIWAAWLRDDRKESAGLPSFHCRVIAFVMTLLSGLYLSGDSSLSWKNCTMRKNRNFEKWRGAILNNKLL